MSSLLNPVVLVKWLIVVKLVEFKISSHWIIVFRVHRGIGIGFKLPGVRGKIITDLGAVQIIDIGVVTEVIIKRFLGYKGIPIVLCIMLGGSYATIGRPISHPLSITGCCKKHENQQVTYHSGSFPFSVKWDHLIYLK